MTCSFQMESSPDGPTVQHIHPDLYFERCKISTAPCPEPLYNEKLFMHQSVIANDRNYLRQSKSGQIGDCKCWLLFLLSWWFRKQEDGCSTKGLLK